MKQFSKLLVAAAICSFGFIGCGLLGPSDPSSPEVKLDNVIGSIGVGSYSNVTGSVSAGEAITSISYKIENSSGATASGITVTGPTIPADTKKFNFTNTSPIVITVANSATAADYKLVISVTAGSSVEVKFDFSVTGTTQQGTPVTTVTLDAGANGNSTLGSSIDLDGGTVWKMADAANNVSKIDICYAHSGTENNDKVGSASWAKASGYDFAANWASPPDCKMHSVTMTETEFNATTTKEEVAALWDDSKVSATAPYKLAVTQGSVFIVKTTENVLALVRVSSQTAGSTGSITIKVAK